MTKISKNQGIGNPKSTEINKWEKWEDFIEEWEEDYNKGFYTLEETNEKIAEWNELIKLLDKQINLDLVEFQKAELEDLQKQRANLQQSLSEENHSYSQQNNLREKVSTLERTIEVLQNRQAQKNPPPLEIEE